MRYESESPWSSPAEMLNAFRIYNCAKKYLGPEKYIRLSGNDLLCSKKTFNGIGQSPFFGLLNIQFLYLTGRDRLSPSMDHNDRKAGGWPEHLQRAVSTAEVLVRPWTSAVCRAGRQASEPGPPAEIDGNATLPHQRTHGALQLRLRAHQNGRWKVLFLVSTVTTDAFGPGFSRQLTSSRLQ